MFETREAQIAETDKQEQAEAAKSHTWVNFTQAPALTDAQLVRARCRSEVRSSINRRRALCPFLARRKGQAQSAYFALHKSLRLRVRPQPR